MTKKIKKSFRFDIDNLSLRSCDKNLSLDFDKNGYDTAEIVQWFVENDEKKFCFTIAYWLIDSEGVELKFVGNRPLHHSIDKNVFWELIKLGYDLLDKYLEK